MANQFLLLKISSLSNLYELIPDKGGFYFFNSVGDQYFVYTTIYSLLDPRVPEDETYITAYMLGFSCKRFDPNSRRLHDPQSKVTIISIFTQFLLEHPDDAFLYVCDNRDGFARNRYITFKKWFNEANSAYEHYHSQINYGEENWYSAMLIKQDNDRKELFISAYYYTLKKMLDTATED
jgi:hypothetical protein